MTSPLQPLTCKWEINDFTSLLTNTSKTLNHPTNSSISFKIYLNPYGYSDYMSEYAMIYLAFNKNDNLDDTDDEAHFRLSILGSKKNIIHGKNFDIFG